MEVPAKVLKAAADVVSQYGEHFELLGKYDGKDVYNYIFPEDMIIGFPFVYLYDGKKTTFINGQKARDIIKSFYVK